MNDVAPDAVKWLGLTAYYTLANGKNTGLLEIREQVAMQAGTAADRILAAVKADCGAEVTTERVTRAIVRRTLDWIVATHKAA